MISDMLVGGMRQRGFPLVEEDSSSLKIPPPKREFNRNQLVTGGKLKINRQPGANFDGVCN